MISTEDYKDIFTGNGSTTAFSFDFKAFSEAGIRVVLFDTTTGAESELTNDVHYTLVLNASQDTDPGGTVTYPASGSTALAATQKLVVARTDSLRQSVSFYAGMPMSAVEDSADYLVALCQQLKEKIQRSFRLGVSESSELSSFSDPAARAGKFLQFSDDANALPELVEGLTAGAVLSRSAIGGYIYPVTDAETAAGVVPVDTGYRPGNVLRYGTNTTPGTTDMTAAFQAAIDSMGQIRGRVYVPAGTYKITDATISNGSECDIYGDGNGSIIEGTISLTGTTPVSPDTGTSVLRVTISDLAFIGADRTTSVGIDTYSTWLLTIQRCAFKTQLYAIRYDYANRDKVIDCTFEDTEHCWYQGSNNKSADLTYSRNYSGSYVSYGVDATYTDGLAVCDNFFFGSGAKTGFDYTHAHVRCRAGGSGATNYLRISNNTFFEVGSLIDADADTDSGAIVLQGVHTQIVIADNNFGNNYQPIKIAATGTSERGAITGNFIQMATDAGGERANCHTITCSGFRWLTVSNNHIYLPGASTTNTYDAINLTDCDNALVSNNHAIATPSLTHRYLCYFNSCANAYAHGNYSLSHGTGIIGQTGSTEVIELNNRDASDDNVINLDNTGTPSVANGTSFATSGTTTITGFSDGVAGQEITILCQHSLTFDVTGTNLSGSSADIAVNSPDMIKWWTADGTNWRLIAYVDASADNSGGA